jgi:hypothetical protein
MTKSDDLIKAQLDELIQQGGQVLDTRHKIPHVGGIWVDGALCQQWRTSCRNFLSRVVGDDVHYTDFEKNTGNSEDKVKQALAVMQALKADMEAGFLFERDELIKAEVFNDILEQAEHLLGHGYKDPAAVLVGAVLETTLRNMCLARKIELSDRDTINPMNDKLATATPPAYSKLTQKRIVAWADIRNNAAHGAFEKYTEKDVQNMYESVRGFAEEQARRPI